MIARPPEVLRPSIKIVEARTKKDFTAFIEFPLSLYQGDNLYSPQLTHDMRAHFSSRNPFFKSADVKFFMAVRDGKVVGRIASIINHEHIRLHRDKAGFFGFFECINDKTVSDILLGAAYEEARRQGMEILRGPMDFSTNEQCGIMIEGFESPPMIMTPYNPAYYSELMESFGMAKGKDLFGFVYTVKDALPDKVLRVAALAERKGLTIRTLDKKNFITDMLAFKEVYNSAWNENWGFIPLSEEELLYSASRLKPIIVPDLIVIAEHHQKPVGFLGMVPDYNFVLRHMHGKLTPLTLAKALYYSKKVKDLRLLLLGIKKEYRNRGVDALLFREGFRGVKRGNYEHVEFSWILEGNIDVIRIVEMIGSRLYKKYRIYEKQIV